MVNLKSLFAIFTVFGLLFVLLGLARLGIDLWSYYHASGPAQAHLDFRGVPIIVTGLIMAAIFFGLCLMREY